MKYRTPDSTDRWYSLPCGTGSLTEYAILISLGLNLRLLLNWFFIFCAKSLSFSSRLIPVRSLATTYNNYLYFKWRGDTHLLLIDLIISDWEGGVEKASLGKTTHYKPYAFLKIAHLNKKYYPTVDVKFGWKNTPPANPPIFPIINNE